MHNCLGEENTVFEHDGGEDLFRSGLYFLVCNLSYARRAMSSLHPQLKKHVVFPSCEAQNMQEAPKRQRAFTDEDSKFMGCGMMRSLDLVSAHVKPCLETRPEYYSNVSCG